MRYGAILTRLSERIAALFGKIPYPVVDTILPTMQTRALMSAARFGVFEALAKGPQTAEAAAESCRVDAPTLKLTLRVLVSMGYVTEQAAGGPAAEPCFALTAMGRATLLPGGMALGEYIDFNYHQWELVKVLDEVLASGQGNEFHRSIQDEAFWRSYQRAMRALSRTVAPFLARTVRIAPGAQHMLDIAGSHGLLGAAICRAHPGLTSTVLDLPAALPHAMEVAQEEGIADVVQHKAGDLLTDEFGSGLDLVLYSNIAHHFDFQTNLGVLRRVRKALKPGCALALWDFELPPDGVREGAADAMALYFRIISTAQCYSAQQYRALLQEAGFERVEQKRDPLQPVMILTQGCA